MITTRKYTYFLFTIILIGILGLSSCSKKEELIAFKGRVVNADNKSVPAATVEIYNTSEDWLTGLNVVATIGTDAAGYFESEAIYEPGEYFIFIEKYDTSNWEIRQVEQGIYPTISIPEDQGNTHVVDYNNMSAMASTSWVLTNVHKEYTRPGATAVEWQSIWTGVNNCRRDNAIYFNKDLSFRVYEGVTICKNEERNVYGTFVPPLIFSLNSCQTLPNTALLVKEFEYDGWKNMQDLDAKMYLSCNPNVGQVFILYTGTDGLQVLEVYSRQ